MVREVTPRTWSVLGIACAVYAALGWWLSSSGLTEMWMYRIGLTAASVAGLAFAVAYAVTSRGWWRNEVGTSLVLIALAVIPTTAPLAYAFWFDGGVLTTSWLGWLAVSGPAVSALFLGWAAGIWVRLRRVPQVTCPDGHRVTVSAVYCPVCGKRISA